MSDWLHLHLQHSFLWATMIAMIPITLINFSAMRKRKRGLPPPYTTDRQKVFCVVLLIGLCFVGVFAEFR
jgi:hypothetical membrane protein